MAASGRPIEITFTPTVGGVVVVTVAFTCVGTGSDWGTGAKAMVFCEQDGVTNYGHETRLGEIRSAYTLVGSFTISAGTAVKVGVFCQLSGATSRSFYDLAARAEHIKR